jgi:hypothetical protein
MESSSSYRKHNTLNHWQFWKEERGGNPIHLPNDSGWTKGKRNGKWIDNYVTSAVSSCRLLLI